MSKVNIGSCGLGCVLCLEHLKGKCQGCDASKMEGCEVKKCCTERSLSACYQCEDYPCDKELFKNHRVRAFNECARELGVEVLCQCLENNDKIGIKYHKEDGTPGDYDKLQTEEDIIGLIKEGQDPR